MRGKATWLLGAAWGLCLLLLLAVPARADAVTDTIGIYVGYYGWSEEDYLEKATYHWTELDDWYGGCLDTHEMIYSYYSGSRTYLVAARGFYIRDLFQLAGIDFGSIASVDFFTRDYNNGAYRSFSKYSLFDLPRYYFPNLAANEETGEVYAYDGDDIWSGATQVEAMLALEDFTEWDCVGSEFEQLYDSSLLSPNCRFHLFFGQSTPTEASTSSAAKYCYKILVTFSGSPVLSTGESNLDMKVGSGRTLTVDVDAEDGLLNDFVRENLTWSSSDSRVVSVDENGRLSVHAAGTAVITAAFGQSTVSVTVTVDDEGGGAGTLSGGAESGEGTAAPGQAPSTEETPPEEADTVTALEPAAPELPEEAAEEIVSGKLAFAISPEALAGLLHGREDAPQANGGAMDEDSQQLVLQAQEEPALTGLLLAAFAAAFLLGAAYGLLQFKRSGKR